MVHCSDTIVVPPDLRVAGGGSIYLLCPETETGRQWIADNLALESWQFLGNNAAIENRYIGDIVEGTIADGLTVE